MTFAAGKAVRENLAASGITPEAAKYAGVHLHEDRMEFVYQRINGETRDDFARTRYVPDIVIEGKPTRYRQPRGTGNHLYLPRNKQFDWKKKIHDVKTPVTITEGEKKAIKACVEGIACIGISGNRSWLQNGKPLDDFKQIKWRKRHVEIVMDSDGAHKPNVSGPFFELGDYLTSLGAQVSYRVLPTLSGTKKTGLDDYLVAKGRKSYDELPVHAHESEYVSAWRGKAQNAGIDLDLTPVPVDWLEAKPPEIEFLWEPFIPTHTVAMLTAVGGAGKTFFAIDLCMHVAAGERFHGFKTRKGRALLLALEDPLDVLQRRVHWLFQSRFSELKKESPTRAAAFAKAVRENLVVASQAGKQLHLLTMEKNCVVQSDAVENLAVQIRDEEFELVVIDPLARTHGLNENDNAVGTALINAAERIANEGRCTVLITHHVGKSNAAAKGSGSGAQYSARGASGLSDAARVVLHLKEVSRDEIANADAAVIELTHAKSNYGPRFDKPVYLRRTTHGVLEKFAPEFTKNGNNYDAWLQKLREAKLERFTERKVCQEKRSEIFGKGFSRTDCERFLEEALTSGDVERTGEKCKGGGAWLRAAAHKETTHGN